MPTKSVKLNVLTSGVDRAISDMTKLSASKSDLSKGATIRLTLQDSDLTAEKLDALKLSVEDLSDKGADIRIKLEGAGTAETELAGLKADTDALSLSGANVSGSLKNVGEDAEESTGKFSGLLSRVSSVGLMVFGAAAGAGVYEAIKQTMSYQKQLTLLVTDAGESQKNLSLVDTGIKNIAIDTGTSLSQLTSGAFMIESAGFHGAAAIEVLRAAAEGAKTSGADLGTVANALTTVMKDYGLSANKATAAASGMNAIVSHGKVTLEDLASSMSRVLPTASSLGIKFGDVGGAMATMTGEGVSAKLAAMGINSAMLAMANPNAVAAKTMTEFGGSAKDVANTLTHQGLIAAMAKVADLALNAGPKGSAAYVAALDKMMGGNRGLQVALDTTGGHLTTTEANVLAVSKAYDGAGKDVTGFALSQQTLSARMDQLKETLQVTAVNLGERLLPAATAVMTVLAKLGQNKDAMIVLTLAVSGLALAMVYLKVASFIAGLALKDALISSGVGILILALSIGIYELLEHWKTVDAWLKGTWHATWSAIAGAFHDVFDWLKTNWPYILGILTGPFGLAAAIIYKHLGTIENTVKSVWSDIWSALVAPVIKGFDDVKNAITGGFDGWWTSHGAMIEGIWRDTWMAVKAVFDAVWEPLLSAAKADIGFLTDVFKVGLDVISTVFNATFGFILSQLRTFWSNTTTLAIDGWAVISLLFKTALRVISDLFKAEFDIMEAIGVSVFDAIETSLKISWDIITGIFSVALDLITGHWSAAWHDMLNMVNQISGNIKTLINQFTGWIGQKFASAGTWLVNAGRALIQGLYNGALDIIGDVGSWVSGIGNKIINAVKNFFGIHSPSAVFADLGKNMMLGLIKGMISNNPATMITKLLGGMPGMFKDLLLGGFLKNITAMGSTAMKLVQGWGTSALNALGKAGSAIGGFFSKLFGGGSGGSGVSQWKSLVDVALMLNGLPDSLDTRVLYQMQTESGGNANAINLTDINAQNGDPSRGLMQVIGTTFMGYHVAGTSDNIYDPLANIAAAINYAKHVYGPSLMSGGMGIGSGHGYFAGGIIPELVLGMGMRSGERYSFGERGPELVTPMGGSVGSSGNTIVNVSMGIVTDPNATAQAIHQLLRRYKTKKGGGPLGLG